MSDGDIYQRAADAAITTLGQAYVWLAEIPPIYDVCIRRTNRTYTHGSDHFNIYGEKIGAAPGWAEQNWKAVICKSLAIDDPLTEHPLVQEHIAGGEGDTILDAIQVLHADYHRYLGRKKAEADR